MVAFHRVVFYLGTFVTVYAFVLTPTEPGNVAIDSLAGTVFALFGFFSFFYMYAVGFCLVDIFWKRWRRLYLWLPLVIVVPLIGPYIYFEKYIFPTYLRRKTAEEKANEPPPVVVPATARALWHRGAASLVDFTVLFAFFSLYILANGTRGADGIWRLQGGPHIFLFLVVWLFYLPVAEAIWGKTLGKALFGVRVIMLRGGGKITFGAALKRHLLDLLDLIIALGVFAIATSRRSMPRRLGDYWAGTVVTLDARDQEQPAADRASTNIELDHSTLT